MHEERNESRFERGLAMLVEIDRSMGSEVVAPLPLP